MTWVSSSPSVTSGSSPSTSGWTLGVAPKSAVLSAGAGFRHPALGVLLGSASIVADPVFLLPDRVRRVSLAGARLSRQGWRTRFRTPTIATGPIAVISWVAAVMAARRVRRTSATTSTMSLTATSASGSETVRSGPLSTITTSARTLSCAKIRWSRAESNRSAG